MAVVKTVLKASDMEAVVKVAGTSGSATISLSADLLSSNQVLDGATQSVSITALQWSGGTDGIIEIKRNNVVIVTLQANNSGEFDFGGQMMTPDSVNSTYNLAVTISGAECQCWLRLKKNSGYKSNIEYSVYGSYDDPTQSGA